jgi:hypothetical protein
MTALTLRPVLRGPKLIVTLVLIAVTIGLVVAQISVRTGTSEPVPTISDQGYAKSISALSPAQLSAAFGTEQRGTSATAAAPVADGYAQRIARLTPEQLAAAFGNGR